MRRLAEALPLLFLASLTFSTTVAQSAFFAAVLLALLANTREFLRRAKQVSITAPLLCFFSAALISLVFHAEQVQPLRCALKLKHFLLFAVYYYFFFLSPPLLKIKRYVGVLVAGFTLTLLYVILQHLLGSAALPYRYETFQWDRGARIYPLYGQLSSIIMIAILPALLFAKEGLSGKERLFLAAALPPMLAALYLSFSRTAVLGVCVALLLMLYLRGQTKILLLSFLVIAAVFSYNVINNKNNLVTSVVRLTDAQNVRAGSNSSRVTMLKDTLDIFKDRPLTGIGYFGYNYYAAARNRSNDKISSDYLQVLATTGLLGFLPFCWLLLVFLRESFAALKLAAAPGRHDLARHLSFGMFLAYSSFLTNAAFEPVFFNSETLMLMLFFLAVTHALKGPAGAGTTPPLGDAPLPACGECRR